MARISVIVRSGAAASVRVRSCRSTPVGVKRTCSASSASTDSRAIPAGSAVSAPGSAGPSTGLPRPRGRDVAAARSSSAWSRRPGRSRGHLTAMRASPAAVGADAGRLLFGFAAVRRARWVAAFNSGVGKPACRCMVLIADRRRAEGAPAEPGGAVDQVSG